MADNTVIPAGAGGDSIRDIDKGGIKTQVVTLDLGGAGAESLIAGSMPVTGPLTDAQLRAAAVPVSGTFWQSTQPVSLATNTPTIQTGSNTIGAVTAPGAAALALDATLTGGTAKAVARGGAKGTTTAADLTSNPVDANTQALHVNLAGTNAVNATLAAETTKVIGTVNQGTSPWVTNDPGLPDTLGQKTMANSTGVVLASDQSSIPVAATLAAETTKVIGTVNVAAAQTIAVTQATASSLNAQVVGAAADAASASGNPVTIGLTARQTNRTAVSDGQNVRAAADDMGRAVMVLGQVRDLMTDAHTQIASSSAETTILAAAASTFHDMTQLVLTNQTATAVNVTIRDVAAGSARMIIALAASGGAVIPFARPVKQATVNTAWTAQLSSAAVTVNIYIQAEKNV